MIKVVTRKYNKTIFLQICTVYMYILCIIHSSVIHAPQTNMQKNTSIPTLRIEPWQTRMYNPKFHQWFDRNAISLCSDLTSGGDRLKVKHESSHVLGDESRSCGNSIARNCRMDHQNLCQLGIVKVIELLSPARKWGPTWTFHWLSLAELRKRKDTTSAWGGDVDDCRLLRWILYTRCFWMWGLVFSSFALSLNSIIHILYTYIPRTQTTHMLEKFNP